MAAADWIDKLLGIVHGKPVNLIDAKDNGAGGVTVVHNGYSVVNLEGFGPCPTRKRGKVTFTDAHGFVEYVNRHATAHSVVYCAHQGMKIAGKDLAVAFLNDHSVESDGAGWRDHIACLCPIVSNDWETWTANSGMAKAKSQTDMADFLENNAHCIFDPTPAAMLTIVKNMSIRRAVTFKSSVNLEDGTSVLEYQDQNTKGSMKVPAAMTLRMPIFAGSEPIAVMCRFRYRLQETQALLWYEIVGAEKVLEEAGSAAVELAASNTDGIVLYLNGRVV